MPQKRYNAAKLRTAARRLAAVLICIAAAAMPGAAAAGAEEGVKLCLTHVIPPLFTLMFAVILMTECGASELLSDALAPVCSRVFGLSGCAGAALAASLVGGYPAGAKTAAQLYDMGVISRGEAARISMFCFGAGPAFILGTLGSVLPMSSACLLLAVQPAAMAVCGMILRLFPLKIENVPSNNKKKAPPRPLSDCIVSSTEKTAAALLEICAFVVLFRALRSMLDGCGCTELVERLLTAAGMRQELAEAVLPMLLEVTSGSLAACGAGLPAAAFALGFGGLSVHMQVYGICRRIGLDPITFTAMRLLQGTVSALLTHIIASTLHIERSAAAEECVRLTRDHPSGAVTLFVMCVMLVLCTGGDSLSETDSGTA